MASSGGIKAGKAFVFIEAVDKTKMVLNRVNARFKQFGERMGAMGKSFLTKGLASLVPVALSMKVFANFDDAMKKVEARAAGTAGEMQALRDQAKMLGRTTSNTATQIGELQAKLGQKGFDRSQILLMTADIRNLARAAGEGGESDTTVAADLVSGTLRAFQLGADQAGRVADVFTTAVNNSNFSMEGLLDAMAKGGPLASSYNMSIEETVASLASMTNLNIKASEAGTAFNSFLARFSKEQFTTTFNKKLKALNGNMVRFTDEAGNLRKPLDLLKEIGEATASLGSGTRGDVMSELFGVKQFGKGVGGAAGAIDAQKLLKKLVNESGGEAERVAALMDSGIGGSFRRVMSAVEGVAISIGESLAPAMMELSKIIEANLGVVVEWIEKNKGIIITAVAVAAGVVGIGAALIVLGAAISLASFGMSALMATFGVMASILGLIFSPIGLIVIALSGLIAMVIKVRGTIDNAFTGLANDIAGWFGGMAEEISAVFGGIMEALELGDSQAAWEIGIAGLTIVWMGFVDTIMDAWEGFIDFFATNFEGAINTIITAWKMAEKAITNGIIEIARKEGILGDALDVILGIDVSEVEAEANRNENQRIAANKADQARIPEIEDRIKRKKTDLTGAIGGLGEGVDKKAVFDFLAKNAESFNQSGQFGFDARGGPNAGKGDAFPQREGVEGLLGGKKQALAGLEGLGVTDPETAKNLKDLAADIAGQGNLIRSFEGFDLTFRNAMDEGIAQMNEDFDKGIEDAASGKTLEDFRAGLKKSNEERKKEITDRKAALKAQLADIHAKAEAAKAAREGEAAEDKAKKEQEDKDKKAANQLAGPQGVAPSLLKGLEKGSIEAAQQFQKNKAQGMDGKQLKEAIEANVHLQAIDANLKDAAVINLNLV